MSHVHGSLVHSHVQAYHFSIPTPEAIQVAPSKSVTKGRGEGLRFGVKPARCLRAETKSTRALNHIKSLEHFLTFIFLFLERTEA